METEELSIKHESISQQGKFTNYTTFVNVWYCPS